MKIDLRRIKQETLVHFFFKILAYYIYYFESAYRE